MSINRSLIYLVFVTMLPFFLKRLFSTLYFTKTEGNFFFFLDSLSHERCGLVKRVKIFLDDLGSIVHYLKRSSSNFIMASLIPFILEQNFHQYLNSN